MSDGSSIPTNIGLTEEWQRQSAAAEARSTTRQFRYRPTAIVHTDLLHDEKEPTSQLTQSQSSTANSDANDDAHDNHHQRWPLSSVCVDIQHEVRDYVYLISLVMKMKDKICGGKATECGVFCFPLLRRVIRRMTDRANVTF